MFAIELKFYHREWKNYFKKQYNKKEAIKLFQNLVKNFPDSEWRIVYKPIPGEN